MNARDFIDEHADRSKKYNVFATRGNLNEMNKQLKQALKGAKACKSLKDILRIKVKLYLSDYEKDLLTMKLALENADSAYQRARFVGPNYGPFIEASIDKAQKRVLRESCDWCGFHTFTFELYDTGVDYQFGLLGLATSGRQLSKVRETYSKALDCMIDMCSLRNEMNAAMRLFGQISRRFNGLTKVVLPKTINTIEYIVSELEENDRFEFFSMKRMKRRRLRTVSDQMDMELEQRLKEASEEDLETSGVEVKVTRSIPRMSRQHDRFKSGLIPLIQESIFGILPISRINLSALRDLSNDSTLATWTEEDSQLEFSSSAERSSSSEVIFITNGAPSNQNWMDEKPHSPTENSSRLDGVTTNERRESADASPESSNVDDSEWSYSSSETLHPLAGPGDLPSMMINSNIRIADEERRESLQRSVASRSERRVSFYKANKSKKSCSLIETRYSLDRRTKKTGANESGVRVERLVTVRNEVRFSPVDTRGVWYGVTAAPKRTLQTVKELNPCPHFSVSETHPTQVLTDDASLRDIEEELIDYRPNEPSDGGSSTSSSMSSMDSNDTLVHKNDTTPVEDLLQSRVSEFSAYSTTRNFDGTPYLSALDGPALLATFYAQVLSRLLRNLNVLEDDPCDETPPENP